MTSFQKQAARDRQLLEEATEVISQVGCQGWACDGPTLRPVHMVTCCRCATLARLAKRLDCYVAPKDRPKNERADTACRVKLILRHDLGLD
jgi:hypothetical protein